MNEEGTEASSATSALMAGSKTNISIPVFRADHPFIFFIRDMKMESILFMGRLMNPLLKESIKFITHG